MNKLAIINITKPNLNEYFELPPTSHVGETFKTGRSQFLVVTAEQGASFKRVVNHQGPENYKEAYYNNLDNYLAVLFGHIFIGIEPDGYAHS